MHSFCATSVLLLLCCRERFVGRRQILLQAKATRKAEVEARKAAILEARDLK